VGGGTVGGAEGIMEFLFCDSACNPHYAGGGGSQRDYKRKGIMTFPVLIIKNRFLGESDQWPSNKSQYYIQWQDSTLQKSQVGILQIPT
jgi:hypothetical protein